MLLSEIKDPEMQVFGLLVLYCNLISQRSDSNRIKKKIFHVLTDNNMDGMEEIALFLDSSAGPNETVDAWAEELYALATENPCWQGPNIHPYLSGIDILPLNIRKKYLKCILDAEPRMDPYDPYDIQDMLNCHRGLEFIAASLDESIIRELFLYQKNKEIKILPDHMRYWRARTMSVLFESIKQNSTADDLAEVTKAAKTIENELWYSRHLFMGNINYIPF